MRIKKISPVTPANGNIENQYGTSQTNAYSEEYSNNTFATKDVATTSANGLMSASDKENLDKGTRTQVLWAGSKYSTNDTMELSETMVLGKLYMIEFYGKSGSYKDYKIFRSVGAVANSQVCQINFYSVPDNSGFRYRIETTDGKNLRITDASNTASNTAIIAIYKII